MRAERANLFVGVERKMRTALSILCCLLWTESAFSADPETAGVSTEGTDSPVDTAPTIEEARESFLRGRAFVAEGKWTEAEEQFLFAIRAKNTPGLRYYIGYCRENRGLLVEALESYRLAEDLLETQRAPDVDQIVPAAIERVSGLLPVLFLYDVPAGARLMVDGAERPLSQQFHANPGAHQILIEKDGFESFSATVHLQAGKKARVLVKMAEVSATPDSPANDAETRPDSKQLKRVVFWSSTGLAAGGLGAGVTGAVLFAATKREIERLNEQADETSDSGDSSCAEPSPALERVCADLDRGAKRKNAMGVVMIGGFAAAGVGTAGAVLTHFLWPDTKVRVDVGWLGTEGSVLVTGHF